MAPLTDAQRQEAVRWRQAWVDWSLKCIPADRDRVEDGIRRLYGYAGERWPGVVEWIPSPVPGHLAVRQHTEQVVERRAKGFTRAPGRSAYLVNKIQRSFRPQRTSPNSPYRRRSTTCSLWPTAPWSRSTPRRGGI